MVCSISSGVQCKSRYNLVLSLRGTKQSITYSDCHTSLRYASNDELRISNEAVLDSSTSFHFVQVRGLVPNGQSNEKTATATENFSGNNFIHLIHDHCGCYGSHGIFVTLHNLIAVN
jgi:hypothetical protein